MQKCSFFHLWWISCLHSYHRSLTSLNPTTVAALWCRWSANLTQSTSIKLYWTRRCHLPGCYRSQQFVKTTWETSICQTPTITTCIINRPTRLFAVWQIHPSASSILKHFRNYNQFACFYCKAETAEMDVCQTSWSSVWPRNILTKINKSLNRKMHHFYYEKTIRD